MKLPIGELSRTDIVDIIPTNEANIIRKTTPGILNLEDNVAITPKKIKIKISPSKAPVPTNLSIKTVSQSKGCMIAIMY